MTGSRTRLLGFAEVNYLETERDNVAKGFSLGQLAAHLSSALTDRLAFFSEVTATARPGQFNIEIERAILRYDFADEFKLSAGRYHTPVNYWNVSYHHGQWLQTTVARPEMTKFGGTFLPVHFIGAMAEAAVRGPIGLAYSIGVGNGRHSNLARGGDAGDVNASRAVLANVFARPSALLGLQVGGSFYRDRILPGTTSFDETIWSGHLVWWRESPELLTEYARVIHEPTAGGTTSSSDAYYLQLAYRLPGAVRQFKPYARLERIDVPASDQVFAPLRMNYRAAIAGLRIDATSYAALKAEFRSERIEGIVDRQKSLYLQASFTFPGDVGQGLSHNESNR